MLLRRHWLMPALAMLTVGNQAARTDGSWKLCVWARQFELMPQKNGKWKEKILHNFGKGKDGIEPSSGLIFDAVGNLYGTTSEGGAIDCGPYYAGTAFELA